MSPAATDGADGPGPAGFRSLAARHRIVPVWRELVADTLTPVAAFLQIVEADHRTGFLLESVEGGERWGRYSFVGRNPLATITARGPVVSTEGDLDLDAATGGRVSGQAGVLSALEAILLTFDSPWRGLLPPGWYMALHLLEANLVTPTLLGRRFTLSPVAIFVSLIFWIWLWGVPGALLSVPILVSIKVVCDRIPRVAGFGELIGR